MFWSLMYAFIALLILLTAFLHLLLPRIFNNRPLYSLLALLFALLILLLPVKEVPMFYYLRGYVGDLSITSSIFLSAFIIQRGGGRLLYEVTEKQYLLWAAALTGLFLYPLALGLGQFDPYRLGYEPQLLLSILFFLAIYLWYKTYYFLLFLVTSAVLAFISGVLESANLWDYLRDGVLGLFALAGVGYAGVRTTVRRVWK